jgi:hypothetical protein
MGVRKDTFFCSKSSPSTLMIDRNWLLLIPIRGINHTSILHFYIKKTRRLQNINVRFPNS